MKEENIWKVSFPFSLPLPLSIQKLPFFGYNGTYARRMKTRTSRVHLWHSGCKELKLMAEIIKKNESLLCAISSGNIQLGTLTESLKVENPSLKYFDLPTQYQYS